MVLDMANSDSSSATVRVLVSFYLVATDDTSSSSARTSAIHKEKFNVSLSGDCEHSDRFNFVKHPKTFIGLAEIAESKFKISVKRANLHVTFIAFVEIRLFNVFFWERKTG